MLCQVAGAAPLPRLPVRIRPASGRVRPSDGDGRRLGRLSRPVLHLVTLGAELRERKTGLHVIEQGIYPDTAEGQAMFGMLSGLAELQGELILAKQSSSGIRARAWECRRAGFMMRGLVPLIGFAGVGGGTAGAAGAGPVGRRRRRRRWC